MKEIKLTQGQVALVDDEDYEFLNQWKWFAKKDHDKYYAARATMLRPGKQRMIFMHRDALKVEHTVKVEVDHLDGDCLNNQKGNLRLATRSQNCANRRPFKNSSSIFKGVGWVRRTKKWHAKIRKDGVCRHLGYFDIETDAALAYNKSAIELHGEYAYINNIAV